MTEYVRYRGGDALPEIECYSVPDDYDFALGMIKLIEGKGATFEWTHLLDGEWGCKLGPIVGRIFIVNGWPQIWCSYVVVPQP